MRSRSTVLSHVLGSNDGVCGYSELHHPYVRYRDVIKMKIRLYQEFKGDLKNKYLLDKILHNKSEISKEVFEAVKPKVIILIREPESTIKSIMNMGHVTGEEWYKSPKAASDYYCSRLLRLEKYGELLNGNFFFLESDALVNNTDYILSELTEWLGLDTHLVGNYMLFNNTGKRGYGDPTETIKSKKIIKTKGYPDIEIPPEALQTAIAAYGECKGSLLKLKERNSQLS